MTENTKIFNAKVADIKTHLEEKIPSHLLSKMKLTCVIYRCNIIDGIMNALFCINAGYDVLVLDFSRHCETIFDEYHNAKYMKLDLTDKFNEIKDKCFSIITPSFDRENYNKNYENFCVIAAQLTNQFHGDFSLLTCGINNDILNLGQQLKYGEKGDKNFISDMSRTTIVDILSEIFDINFNHDVLESYFNITPDSNSYHKVNYPVYLNRSNSDRVEDKYAKKISRESIECPPTEFPMTENVASILDEFRTKQGFYDECWDSLFVQDKVRRMIDYCNSVQRYDLFLAISGGIDSSVVYMILSRICDVDPRFRLHAVGLPINSTPEIQTRAYQMCEILQKPYSIVDSTSEHLHLCEYVVSTMISVGLTVDDTKRHYNFGCAKSNYRGFIMNLFSSANRGLVIGTGNEDEDAFLRFFSVYGDGFVDIDFIGDVPKFFMYRLAKYLGVPRSTCIAAPSADLMPEKTDKNTDEGEIGSSYQFAEFLLFNLRSPLIANQIIKKYMLLDSDLDNLNQNLKKIIAVHSASKHKVVKPENVFTPQINDKFIKQTSEMIETYTSKNDKIPYRDENTTDVSTVLNIFKHKKYIYFSGSFSIPTKSHLQMIVDSCKYLLSSSDSNIEFCISPTSSTYGKESIVESNISSDDRFRMCVLLIREACKILASTEDISRLKFRCSTYELKSTIYKGTCYYIDEFCNLNNTLKENVYFLMGYDNVEGLFSIEKPWIDVVNFLTNYNFIIVDRDNKFDILDIWKKYNKLFQYFGLKSPELNILNKFKVIKLTQNANLSSSEASRILKLKDISEYNREILLKKIISDEIYNFLKSIKK